MKRNIVLLSLIALVALSSTAYAQDTAWQRFYERLAGGGEQEQVSVGGDFLPLSGGTINGRVNINNTLFIQAGESTENGRLYFERELTGGRDGRSPANDSDNNTHRWAFLHRQSEGSSGDFAREGDLELWEYELDTANRTCDSRYAINGDTEEQLLDPDGNVIAVPEGQTAYDYIFSLRDAAAEGSSERSHYQNLLAQNPTFLGDGSGYCNSRIMAFEKKTGNVIFSNNVGIGNSNPSMGLEISAASATLGLNDLNDTTGMWSFDHYSTGPLRLQRRDPNGQNAQNLVTFDTDGSVSIGTTDAGSNRLYVYSEHENATGYAQSTRETQRVTDSSACNANGQCYNKGLHSVANSYIGAGQTNNGYLVGIHSTAFNRSVSGGAGDLNDLRGLWIQYGNYRSSDSYPIGKITNAYGIRLDSYQSSGDITNNYGVYVDNVRGDNTYGIYQAHSTDSNYFAGDIEAKGFFYTSDARLKEDVRPLPDSLNKILSLEGVNYKWRDTAKGEDVQIGFIAQDVEKVIPELVTEDAEGMKSVDYARVVPILVEAIKQQQEQIDALQTELVK